MNAKITERVNEEAYRMYVTRSLQLIPQNRYITKDFTDIINGDNIDNRSGEDIAIDIIKGAGLSFEGAI